MSWDKVKLKNICEVFNDGNWIESKDQSDNGIRLIQTGNIKLGTFADRKNKARYISEKTFKGLNCREIFAGDILVSRLPDPVGRACIIPKLSERAITAVDCTIIRLKKICLPKYLNYFMQSSQYFMNVSKEISGATRQRISRKNLGEILIPLPSLSEQQSIIDKLDSSFAKIDKVIQLTKAKIKNYFNLEEISKNNFFSNLSSSLIELEKIAEIINGYAFKSDDFQNSKGVPVIKITNVGIRDFVETNDVNLSKNFLDTHKQFIVKEGDIVFALTRTVINGGLKVAVVPKSYEGALLNQRVASVSANPKLMNNEFLYSFLTSSMVLDYVLSNVNTLMQPNLSITDLKKLPVPIIPIDKQIAYTQKLKEKEIHFQNIRTIETKKLSELENLKSAILSQELQSKAA